MSPDRPHLTPLVLAFRAIHAVIALTFVWAIAYVWLCVLTGRRDRLVYAAAGALAAEGILVGLNHGDCPLGPLQDRVGDPVPLFELLLSPVAAKRAVPVLGGIAALGIILLGRRPACVDDWTSQSTIDVATAR